MQKKFETNRLLLNTLSLSDTKFIFELVNTPGWLNFIGDRKIKSEEDAAVYIKKIMTNTNVFYWVARLKNGEAPIGIVTLIKRAYLPRHDIGFAFLPLYSKKGYAYEATKEVLDYITKDYFYKNIFAITVKGNISSIRLLEKLGLKFENEIVIEKDELLLYKM